MDAKLQARCYQQIKNEKALRIISTQVSEPSIKVGSLLYTSLDLPVSDDNVYAAQQILETKGRFFSNFRGVLQALILLRMAVSKKPEAYIDTIIKNNAERAAYTASKTLRKVQKKVGFPERVR